MPLTVSPESLRLLRAPGGRLTEDDYREVADELGIETAAMKAVVAIEAGASHRGFYKKGMPVINFDLTMFRRFGRRRGVKTTGLPSGRTGSQAVHYDRLSKAMERDTATAREATFWGMFQIGGFNWKKCGAKSLNDFVRRMSYSERDQLELFAAFLRTTGLDEHLREHKWAAFARGYNGTAYARRRYHTRLAASYAKFKKSEKSEHK